VYPIIDFVVEDIKARTKGRRRWDRSFSPLEVGKQWFYDELRKLGHVETRQGWETKELRNAYGLKKSGNKMVETFEAHCVDSWVLANWWVGGHIKPDNKEMLFVTPLHFTVASFTRCNPRRVVFADPMAGCAAWDSNADRGLSMRNGACVMWVVRWETGLVFTTWRQARGCARMPSQKIADF